MVSQLAPRVRTGRGIVGWIGLSVGVAVAVVVAVGIGVLALVVAAVAWAIRGVVWLIVWLWAWLWFGIQRLRGRSYPFPLDPPVRSRQRDVVVNDAYLVAFPRLIGVAARVSVFLFAPIVLFASLAGIVLPQWRARPYLAVFSMPALVRKLVGLGRRRGFFADGHRAEVVGYETFLAETFPILSDFLGWWVDPDAPTEYPSANQRRSDPTRGREGPGTPAQPADLRGAAEGSADDGEREAPESALGGTADGFGELALGPYPDPLGYPGLATAAMRRREIRSLRELLVSQREIDDLGDPDLDDRADAAVIRTVSRIGADGVRRWIVQLPSTQVWHPRSGRAPNDLTADLVALSMRQTTLTRATMEVIRKVGIAPEDRILLAGFSLGGLVALQVAERCVEAGLTVTHIVTAGSPIGRYAVPRGLRLLSIEHLLDPVPPLDGRENPVGESRWLTVKAGPALPLGYRIGSLHQSPSYAETAGKLEDDPPTEQVQDFLHGDGGGGGALDFFGADQQFSDFAATRAGFRVPQAAVPLYLNSTVDDGITRGTLTMTLRRVAGVIAVDIYQSRTGLPTTILWNADVLVRSLRPWFETVERASVYRGLLSLLKRRRAIGIRFRLRAKESPDVVWEATVQRMSDGRWRETVDVSFATAEAEAQYLPLLLPDGWASTITYYPADAFAPRVRP